MKKSIILYGCFIVAGCIALVSCNKNDKKEVKEYYQSGKLKKSGWYTKDNTPVDTAFYFFENGNYERIEIRNDSGLLNGISKSFHDNGHLYQEIPYVNNTIEGFIYTYKENGQLSSKIYQLKTRQIGDGFWYDENGKISQYGFNGFGNNHRNYIKYDNNGKILDKIAPFIMMDSISSYTPGTKKNEVYKVALLLSNPPNCRTSVLINYLTKDSIITKQDSVTAKPYYFKEETFSTDLYSIVFYGKQYDSLTGKTLLQNMSRPIN
jgi:hypothetical protein